MKSGHVQDYQVTASSIFRTLNMDMFTWEPGKARLDKQGKVNAWTAGHSDQSQWLQVKFNLILISYLYMYATEKSLYWFGNEHPAESWYNILCKWI